MRRLFVLTLVVMGAFRLVSADSLIDRRNNYEDKSEDNPFVLTTHRANYFFPIAYNVDPNSAPFSDPGDPAVHHTEVKFQISVKFEIARGLFYGYGRLGIGYTQQSYWQAYNGESTPFRETNYEPEPMLSFPMDYDTGWFHLRMLRASFDHQSNGRADDLSRSWNRIVGEALLEWEDLYLKVRPWYRLPEPNGKDDNPDINDYMGYGDLEFLYQLGRQQFGLLLRENVRTSKGAFQLEWSFPMHRKFSWFLQYFDGYGESLIDYNHHNRRVSLGVLLANWL